MYALQCVRDLEPEQRKYLVDRSLERFEPTTALVCGYWSHCLQVTTHTEPASNQGLVAPSEARHEGMG